MCYWLLSPTHTVTFPRVDAVSQLSLLTATTAIAMAFWDREHALGAVLRHDTDMWVYLHHDFFFLLIPTQNST